MSDHYLFVEKYRPSTTKDYIGNEHFIEKLNAWIAESDIPHLLLYGPPGTGKTTASKIIINNIDCDYMFINASDENNVETVRNKLKGFASGIGFKSLKVAVLDECLDEDILVWVLRNGKEVSIPIKNVDPNNDLVKSFNINKDRTEWKPFRLFDKGIQEVYEIQLENDETVICTTDHKWYVHESDDIGTDFQCGIKVVKTSELHNYNHILSPE